MFMMCQRIGLSPISTIGFGRTVVSSDSRVPNPPARMTALMAASHTSPAPRVPGDWLLEGHELSLYGPMRRARNITNGIDPYRRPGAVHSPVFGGVGALTLVPSVLARGTDFHPGLRPEAVAFSMVTV